MNLQVRALNYGGLGSKNCPNIRYIYIKKEPCPCGRMILGSFLKYIWVQASRDIWHWLQLTP